MKLTAAFARIGPFPFLLAAAVLVPPAGGNGAHILGLPNLCLFHFLTGLPCPTCGMTRAVICCAHGDLAGAWRFHPLSPLVFLLLIALSVQAIFPFPIPGLARWLRIPGILFVVALMEVWIARLAGAMPSPP